jgi:hypothetical protein
MGNFFSSDKQQGSYSSTTMGSGINVLSTYSDDNFQRSGSRDASGLGGDGSVTRSVSSSALVDGDPDEGQASSYSSSGDMVSSSESEAKNEDDDEDDGASNRRRRPTGKGKGAEGEGSMGYDVILKQLLNGVLTLLWIAGIIFSLKRGLKCSCNIKEKIFSFFKAIIFGPLYYVWLLFDSTCRDWAKAEFSCSKQMAINATAAVAPQ